MSIWQGNARWVPISMVNGARQEDGRRIITSNLHIDPNNFPDAIDFHGMTGRDVRISTAITNGARFPLVSPGGTLFRVCPKIPVDPKDPKSCPYGSTRAAGHVLDGGYFDGGGAVSVADLAYAVMNFAHSRGVNLRPIFIEISNDNDDKDGATTLWRGYFGDSDIVKMQTSGTSDFLADLKGPLDGVFAARGAHGEAAYMWLALQAMGRTPPDANGQSPRDPLSVWGPSSDYVMVRLCTPMPLDWALSEDSRRQADGLLDPKSTRCGVRNAIDKIRADLGPQSPRGAASAGK
jgi:hypothetical protein